MKISEKFTLSLLAGEFSDEEMGRISRIDVTNREFTINRSVFADCINVLKSYRSSDSKNMSDDDLRKLFKSKSKK